VSLATLLTRTATITSRTQSGPPDEDNVPTWVETTTTAACYLEPISSAEATLDQNTEIGDHLAVFAPEVSLDGSDSITVEGHVYEVIGPPRRFNTPRGPHHQEIHVREVTG